MDTPQNELEAIRQMLAELTARVYRIERDLSIQADSIGTQPVTARTQVAPPPPPTSASVAIPSAAAISPLHPAAKESAKAEPEINLESRIGSHWLNRIGITAVLIGVSYFLKFAFDSNWIGPAGRVSIGLLAGIAVVVWSERFRSRGYKAFSYSLKAVGIGALYLSLWAAFQVYSLIPSGAAFVMMLAVTAATAAMALVQDAQLLAAFAITGGFATPLLLSTGQNREAALFSYVLVLDLGTLFLITSKPWRRLLVMGYAGTLLLYVGWYSSFYSRPQLGLTLFFASLFFIIFAIAPLVATHSDGEASRYDSIPALVAFANAVTYFLQAYAMIEEVDRALMAWFALGLAAIYIFLSRQVDTRRMTPGATEVLRLLHLALALGFITAAIPIRLDAHWITIGWFVEAGVLLWVADRIKSEMLNLFALAALVLGVGRLLWFDNFTSTLLIFNLRMATFAVAIVVLGTLAWFASRRQDDAARAVAVVAVIAVNVLALMALSHEVADYYSREMAALQPGRAQWARSEFDELRRLQIARDFTYSFLFMGYGAMLMVVGFFRRSSFVRWQALALIAATIVKVFVYDVSQLDRAYRIVSFIVLGMLLLAISFVYQRDWLQLSAKKNVSDAMDGGKAGA